MASELTRGQIVAATVVVVVLLVGGVALRGIRGRKPVDLIDQPVEDNAIREPMQFLGRGARQRIAELGPRISETNLVAWKSAYRAPYDLSDCPKTAEWLVTPAGQRFERLLGDLRRGTRDEAFAALALLFELVRTTEWAPGLLARTQHAEQLAGLAQEWLRTWSERAATDPLLGEPAVATVVMYGHWMKLASRPLPIGRRDEPYDRAFAFLRTILRDDAGRSTPFAELVRARHPTALASFEGGRDALDGFSAAAKMVFPDLDGECK